MTDKNLPSVELLRKLLRYDPETGALFWCERSPDIYTVADKRSPAVRCAMFNAAWAGAETGLSMCGNGYRMLHLTLNGRRLQILAHRVAWAIHTGRYPDGHIDHVNGVRSDNRIANLRDVTVNENKRNAKRRSDNVSGFGGVYYKTSRRKWIAGITTDGLRTHLGVFDHKFDAVLARLLAERAHGYSMRHGL